MAVKERLIEFAKTKEKSVRAFEIKCGLTIGYINAIRVSIQPDKIQRIAIQYPDLNTGWLLTGEGEMLKSNAEIKGSHHDSEDVVTMSREVFELIKTQQDTILSQQRTIEMLAPRRESNS